MKFSAYWNPKGQIRSTPQQNRNPRLLMAGCFAAIVSSSAAQAIEPDTQVKTQIEEQGYLGPVRLRSSNSTDRDSVTVDGSIKDASQRQLGPVLKRERPFAPTEFERYIHKATGGDPSRDLEKDYLIRRFGIDLMEQAGRHAPSQEASSNIPSDYSINVGDEILLTLWGSIEADLRLTVDRNGHITVPRIGPILVAGRRYSELSQTIDLRVGQVFRNYKISVSLGRLRNIRIYVTGFTQNPGAYTVGSLATLANALMQTGGPSAAGSFRNIEHRRRGKPTTSFDFYDLLLKGDKSGDITLQAEDVIHINPVGTQVALIGSVNRPAIFELKANEALDDLLIMAGGFTAVADRTRLTVEHLDERNASRITELSLPQPKQLPLRNGDMLRAFSAVAVALPQHKQSKRVRVEGEVQKPGEFILPASSNISDAIRAAGGLTKDAYIFGTDFSRESVRIAQQENYERALRDLETEFTRATTTQKAISADEASAQAARAQGSTKLIERLRAIRPTGRIVLQLNAGATSLPDLSLEDGDRISIPARPTTVGVFGSVFNGGSYLWKDGSSLDDVLRLAGGPTRGADASSTFVVRANGSVISSRQNASGWLSFGGAFSQLNALPGDTVFVPEELNKTTFIQEAKEWTQILYQFGLGAAALKTIKN